MLSFLKRPSSTKSHARKNSPRITIASGLIATVLVVLTGTSIAAWHASERSHRDRVARATTIAGIDISKDSPQALETKLTSLQSQLQSASIDIGHKTQRFSTPTASFDLTIDIPATKTAILKQSHTGSAPSRFGRWVRSHFTKTRASAVISFDRVKLASVIATNDPGPRTEPVDPTIAFQDGKFVAVPGVDGHGLVITEAPKAIEKAVNKGIPLKAQISTGVIPSLSTTDDLNTIIEQAERITQLPLQITAASKTATLAPDQLEPLVRALPAGDHLQLDIDATATTEVIQKALSNAGIKPVEAGYTIVDGTPVVIDGKSGTACCASTAPPLVESALLSRLAGGDPNIAVDLPMKDVAPKTTKADIPDTGIKEVTGSFTTRYPAGQPRVTNIHLIADLTRGMVIKPGETFSINDRVGRRTEEKGFVVDHVIVDGKFAEAVGGGISQYATTLFNAAFFGGLDFGEYQSHSIYIDRYPYGREATVSFPHPDLQIKNTTPYGVLVWPTYTNTSLTITLYSTKYASGEQTAQTTEPAGKCTRVKTERTRTYVDGHTAKDQVSALYQPAEGERC